MSKKLKQDVVACGVIYAFIIFCFMQTISMKNGAGIMPQLVLGLATICNTVSLLMTLQKMRHASPDGGYFTFEDIKVPLLMFAGVVVYCILFSFTNYFVATAIMIFVFMMLEKVRPIWMIAVIDAVYLTFVYVLFVVVLSVPLLK